MAGLRQVREPSVSPIDPCCRCQASGCPWDRIADKPICPDCQEALAQGETAPFRERMEMRPCAVCQQMGALRYLTYPLHKVEPIEIDLCAGHFQALLGRRLDRSAFRRLQQQLHTVGIGVRQVFLLHESFYDAQGRPLQPIHEAP